MISVGDEIRFTIAQSCSLDEKVKLEGSIWVSESSFKLNLKSVFRAKKISWQESLLVSFDKFKFLFFEIKVGRDILTIELFENSFLEKKN